MTVDFTQLLGVNADSVKKPAPLPIGMYQSQIKAFKTGESQQKKTPYVRFEYALIAPGEDVDQEALATFRSLGGELSKVNLSQDFYLTEASMYRLTEFLKDTLGINSDNRTVAAMLEEVVGKECYLKVGHRPSQDGKSVFAEITDTMKM